MKESYLLVHTRGKIQKHRNVCNINIYLSEFFWLLLLCVLVYIYVRARVCELCKNLSSVELYVTRSVRV